MLSEYYKGHRGRVAEALTEQNGLCRCIKTEMRWKRKVLSRSSPETAEIFQPRLAEKEQPSSSNGTKDSITRGWNMYILSRAWYLLLFTSCLCHKF